MGIHEFVDVFWHRRHVDDSLKIPKAMEAAFANPQTDAEQQITALIDEFNAGQATKLEQLLFAQKTRLVEAERKLAGQPIKAAAASQRIATDKIAWARSKLNDLARTALTAEDSRIFPQWYAPVLVVENGRRVFMPMRYQCRPASKPASYDRQYPGTYNALGAYLTVSSYVLDDRARPARTRSAIDSASKKSSYLRYCEPALSMATSDRRDSASVDQGIEGAGASIYRRASASLGRLIALKQVGGASAVPDANRPRSRAMSMGRRLHRKRYHRRRAALPALERGVLGDQYLVDGSQACDIDPQRRDLIPKLARPGTRCLELLILRLPPRALATPHRLTDRGGHVRVVVVNQRRRHGGFARDRCDAQACGLGARTPALNA